MARVNDRASGEDTTAALTVSRHGVRCNRLQESCNGQDLGRRSFCVMRPLLQACPLSCMPAHGQGLPHALDGTGRYRTLSGLKLIA